MRYLMLVAAMVVATSASAQSEEEAATLAGVKEFGLLVVISGEGAGDSGLDSEAIATTIEASFRKARLPIVGARAFAKNRSMPQVQIFASIMKQDDGGFVYVVECRFSQAVTLIREPQKPALAATWVATNFGYAGKLKKESIGVAIIRTGDKFMNAFAAENP